MTPDHYSIFVIMLFVGIAGAVLFATFDRRRTAWAWAIFWTGPVALQLWLKGVLG